MEYRHNKVINISGNSLEFKKDITSRLFLQGAQSINGSDLFSDRVAFWSRPPPGDGVWITGTWSANES
jgi:hypothetical protein